MRTPATEADFERPNRLRVNGSAPRADYTPPIPKWKNFDEFADVVSRDDSARSSVADRKRERD